MLPFEQLGALWNHIIQRGSQSGMTETQFLEAELDRFLSSPERREMITGAAYYKGEQEIRRKEREMIGIGGKRTAVYNLPNNRLIDNQYAKLVDQKSNYLLAKPIDVKPADGADKAYGDALADLFGAAFCRRLKNVGKDALNGGISYLVPYVAGDGTLQFKRLPSYQVMPLWADDEHTVMDAALRIYDVTVYEGAIPTVVHKVEYYTPGGIKHFIWKAGMLLADTAETDAAYLTIGDQAYNWERIPLIAFKANADEIPLITRVKSLQDALNTLTSNFADNMVEDVRSSVLVLYNYDGEDLGEFRRNLATLGAIKLRRDDYAKGGVEVLHIDVNADNYKTIMQHIKRAIIENGRGFDSKDERFSAGNVNQMNIQSAFADIDLDADEMEAEFQASLQNVLWFVNAYLEAKGEPVFQGKVTFTFNRDTMVNVSEQIANAKNSLGVISKETVVANHPWTKDTDEELARLKKEQDEQMQRFDQMGGGFGSQQGNET